MPNSVLAGAQQIYSKIIEAIINPALMLLFTVGFFFFVFGIVEFMNEIRKGGDGRAGKQHMLWGVVGMVIMSSIWGIMGLINSTFGLGIDFSNPLNSNINASQIQGFPNVGF
jgi:uncharacterized RDD family membrane protein YckC